MDCKCGCYKTHYVHVLILLSPQYIYSKEMLAAAAEDVSEQLDLH